jgi:hypothetical protein
MTTETKNPKTLGAQPTGGLGAARSGASVHSLCELPKPRQRAICEVIAA